MFTQEELHELSMMAQAIWDLRPNATWELPRPDFDSLVWKDEVQTKPDWADVEARMVILKEEYDARAWVRERLAAYPSIADQLDLIYHGGIDAWRETIKEIKTRIPKPEESI